MFQSIHDIDTAGSGSGSSASRAATSGTWTQAESSSTHRPPTVISLGTVLIDAFDTPPRAIIDTSPLPTHPSHSRRPPLSSPPTPPSPGRVALPDTLSVGTTTVKRPPQASFMTPQATGCLTPQADFDDPPPEHPYEYLGGGALFSMLGARMFAPDTELKTLVDRALGATDLHPDLQQQAAEFGDMWVWNESDSTRMLRGRIRYDGDVRKFQPIVKPSHRTVADLAGTSLEGAEYVHVSPPFSAQDLCTLQDEISSLAQSRGSSAWRPKILFEPTPPSCHTGQRGWLERSCQHLHVLSPNHEELLSFYGYPRVPLNDPFLIDNIETVVQHLLHNVGVGENGSGTIAVRCGRLGACVGTRTGGLRWYPAYFGGEEEERVKDVTGAGNAFIGAFAVGMSLTNDDPYRAILYGTTAASFVVEQIGVPTITHPVIDGVQTELWNGDTPQRRLESLRKRWINEGLLSS